MAIGGIIFLLWMVFWYLFFFRIPKTTAQSHDVRPSRSFRLTAYVLFTSLFLLALTFIPAVFVPLQETENAGAILLGFTLLLLGQALMLVAREALSFLGNHDLLFSITHARVQSGVYRYLHHPMYVGLLLGLLGMTVATNSALALVVVFCGVLPALMLRAWVESRT